MFSGSWFLARKTWKNDWIVLALLHPPEKMPKMNSVFGNSESTARCEWYAEARWVSDHKVLSTVSHYLSYIGIGTYMNERMIQIMQGIDLTMAWKAEGALSAITAVWCAPELYNSMIQCLVGDFDLWIVLLNPFTQTSLSMQSSNRPIFCSSINISLSIHQRKEH